MGRHKSSTEALVKVVVLDGNLKALFTMTDLIKETHLQFPNEIGTDSSIKHARNMLLNKGVITRVGTGGDGKTAIYTSDPDLPKLFSQVRHETLDPGISIDGVMGMLKTYILDQRGESALKEQIIELKLKHSKEIEQLEYKLKEAQDTVTAMRSVLNT